MKKERENQPLDDLFARKLSDLSLPPSADGFDRLRSRMASTESTTKVVFWRNPAVQRYMAAAACLVLVCLLSWLYWSTDSSSEHSSVALQQAGKAPNEQTEKVKNEMAYQQQPVDASRQEVSGEQIARNDKAAGTDQKLVRLPGLERRTNTDLKQSVVASTNQPASTVAQVRPVEHESKLDEPTTIVATNPPTSRLPESTVKPTPSTERVLVVTIDEPAVLVAAQQGKNVVDEKSMVALEDKPTKEAKTGGLWQKMKQLKQGELLAKSDNLSDDDQGLLSRAYVGLKHSIEKNKTTKQ